MSNFRPRKFTFFPFLILFKRIESIDMTPCVISFLVIISICLEDRNVFARFDEISSMTF